MLYKTAGRAEEILGVNIEDLGLARRRCQVKAKGARTKARHRGQGGASLLMLMAKSAALGVRDSSRGGAP